MLIRKQSLDTERDRGKRQRKETKERDKGKRQRKETKERDKGKRQRKETGNIPQRGQRSKVIKMCIGHVCTQ
jgi:hypothetical protein